MKKLLVIDDDASVRISVRAAFHSLDYTVLEAAGGREGIELASAELPDVVLSDIHMEGIDGFGVLARLRSQPNTSMIPVILMTGVPEQAGVRYSMEHGADDYLPKPFECAALLKAVETRLERSRVLRERERANAARLQEILSITRNLIALVDPVTGKISHLNAAGRKMLGVGLEEDVSTLRLCDFTARTETGLAYQEKVAQATQHGVWVGESAFLHRTGKRIPVSEQVSAHQARNGTDAFLSIVALDLTEQQLMEAQLRQAQKLEAVGQLAAGIAHEINTPTQYVGDNTRFFQDAFQGICNAFHAYAELLDAAKRQNVTPELLARTEETVISSDLEYLFEQIPKAIGETLEGVERVRQIVRAMKEFSHPGGKEKALADLNRAIETTVTVARNEWKYVAEMVLDLDRRIPQVPCFIGEFNQAILNLVVNAAHAIADVIKEKPGTLGKISISTRRAGANVEIRVSDTGTGISEANRARIFEPFFTTKELGKGTGQGLAILHANIVKKHNGFITFETESGKGTTFIIRLPIQPPAS